jgi:trigger factor
MQVTETSVTGLKRQLSVVVPKADLAQRYETRVASAQKNVELKGFRKGKVPVGHIKKLFGKSLMTEVLEETLNETSRKIVTDRGERPAMQPEIKLTEDKDEVEKLVSGESDLAFSMAYEVLPKIDVVDFATLKLEREKAVPDAGEVDKAIDNLVARATRYEAEDGRAAGEGDQVTIDFIGKIDGTPFDGGTGNDMPVIIGASGFIPGFEDGLKGAKAGESRVLNATFPADYNRKDLASKPATFDATVKSVAKPIKPDVNDDFAKTVGLDTVDALKKAISDQMQAELDNMSRQKLKRSLLDALDKAHSFDLPQTLVDNEFNGIWEQVTNGLKQSGKTFESEGKTEDAARTEYRDIAARRVRLGLVIGEVGDKNKVEVNQNELRDALIQEARKYPGQERFVYEYYEKNPAALTGLRAPIFEDKVVDIIVGKAQVTDKAVSRDELIKGLNDEEAAA